MTAGSKIYSNAVAKYNEGRLLDAEKLKRVVEAEYDDAVRMLYDYGYGEGLPIEEADAEKLAELEIGKLISFVREYAFDETISAYLLNPYLYNNAKAAYKSRIVAVGRQAYFPGFDEETEAVRTGDYKNLSTVMAAASGATFSSAVRAVCPSTRTRPWRTSSFTSRRDHRPVPARILSSRSISAPPAISSVSIA